jgi:hypothetical protein
LTDDFAMCETLLGPLDGSPLDTLETGNRRNFVGQLFSLPSRAAPQPQPPPALRAADIDVAGVGRLLRMVDRPTRAIVATIRLLVERHGFPEPRSPRFVKCRRLRGAEAVWARSLWARDEVEAWFDDDTPPAVAARTAGAAREEVRAALAERARELVA